MKKDPNACWKHIEYCSSCKHCQNVLLEKMPLIGFTRKISLEEAKKMWPKP